MPRTWRISIFNVGTEYLGSWVSSSMYGSGTGGGLLRSRYLRADSCWAVLQVAQEWTTSFLVVEQANLGESDGWKRLLNEQVIVIIGQGWGNQSHDLSEFPHTGENSCSSIYKQGTSAMLQFWTQDDKLLWIRQHYYFWSLLMSGSRALTTETTAIIQVSNHSA